MKLTEEEWEDFFETIWEGSYVIAAVSEFYKGDKFKTKKWMMAKNPLLGNVTALYMIGIGRGTKLRKIVQAWSNGDLP